MSQTIFDEQFDTEADCAISGIDDSGNGHAWSATCPSDHCDDFGGYCGVDGGFGNFEFRDLDSLNNPDSVFWRTDTIDVDDQTYEEFDIEVVVREFSSLNPDNCFYIRRSLDGGASWQLMTALCDDFGTSPVSITETGIPVDPGTRVIVEIECENDDEVIMVLDRVRIFNAVLPAEQIDLQAETKPYHNHLSWIATSLVEVLSFAVQHSTDGRVWQDLYTTLPTQSPTYTFNHYGPEIGRHYYRIKSLHLDGTDSYSDVVHVYRDQKDHWVRHVSGKTISVFNPLIKNARVKIFDVQGRGLEQRQLAPGESIDLSLGDYATQQMIIQLVGENSTPLTQKLVLPH